MKPFLPMTLLIVPLAGGAQTLRDPTRPPLPVAAHRDTVRDSVPRLSGIFTSGERRAAIVNGRLVHAGDSVDQLAIEAVLADGIRYRQAGVAHALYVKRANPTFKKPAAAPIRVVSGVP